MRRRIACGDDALGVRRPCTASVRRPSTERASPPPPAPNASLRRPSTERVTPPPRHQAPSSAAPARSASVRCPGTEMSVRRPSTERVSLPPRHRARQSAAPAPYVSLRMNSAAPAPSVSLCCPGTFSCASLRRCRPGIVGISLLPLHRARHSARSPPGRLCEWTEHGRVRPPYSCATPALPCASVTGTVSCPAQHRACPNRKDQSRKAAPGRCRIPGSGRPR